MPLIAPGGPKPITSMVSTGARTSMAAARVLGGSSTAKPGKPPLTGYAGGGTPTGAATASGPSAGDTPDMSVNPTYATGDYAGVPTSPVAASIQQQLANLQATSVQAGVSNQGATLAVATPAVAAEDARKKKIVIGAVAAVAVIGLGALAYNEYAKGQSKAKK